jgi:hypothetical protein
MNATPAASTSTIRTLRTVWVISHLLQHKRKPAGRRETPGRSESL